LIYTAYDEKKSKIAVQFSLFLIYSGGVSPDGGPVTQPTGVL
jgi:hypothetical protein